MTQRHIVIDLGASSGRVLSGGKTGEFCEHYRFQVNSRQHHGRLRWDIWQYRSNDHIIRNRKDYEEHCKYIIENPLYWQYDKLYGDK